MKTNSLILVSFLVFTIFSCKTGTTNSNNLTPSQVSVVQGKKVFENSCGACHNFESDGMGPNLASLTKELSFDEIAAFISNPNEIIESGNERAVRLQKKFKTIMPSYNTLGKDKVASLVAYINTYKDITKPKEIIEEGILEDPIAKKVEKADFFLNLEYAFQMPASSDELPYTRITKLVSQPTSGHIYIVCSQIKMNFFAQNLREVSANLVKNFDTVFF